MTTCFQKRRSAVYDWMSREGVALVMLEDSEGRRNQSVRWLSGQPGDALLFLSLERRSLIVPWDANMAALYSDAEMLIPYGEFGRSPVKALKSAAERLRIPNKSRVEIPGATAYPKFLNFVEELSDFDIICRESGVQQEIDKNRAVKDESEINLYRKISAMTDEMIDMVEKNVRAGKLKTEAEVAVFIDSEGRRMGCEGTGFETIAAGAERSFGIHAFPSYTGGEFGGRGFSILDFGLKYAGYASDVTVTFVREPVSKAQEKMLSLVEKAAKLVYPMIKCGQSGREIALAVDALFSRSKKTMPHGLGHGIGLQPHEAPAIRSRSEGEEILEPGMIVAVEPGLYDPVHGGCRLENDFLITETGAEQLTNSRIIRL